MVDCHGSQCGFCTPGFVNSLTGLFECDDPVDDDALRTNLAGNLCRCTGYEPILAAGLSVDPANVRRLSSLYPSRAMVDELAACAEARHSDQDGGAGFSFARFGSRRPSCFARDTPARSSPPVPPSWAWQRNKRGLEPPAILSLAGIGELAKITRDDGVLSVGANVTWARLEAFARGHVARDSRAHPAVRLTADPQCRHAGRQHRPRLAGRRLALFPDDRRGRAGIDQRARQPARGRQGLSHGAEADRPRARRDHHARARFR